MHSLTKQELSRRWDTRTWRDVSSYMITYLPLNYDTPVLRNIFEVGQTRACTRNKRRFTKSALRVLLSCTFRVSSINYSLVCSLTIHTKSSLMQRDRKHIVTWNRVKCCTNVPQIALEKACNRWMTFKVIEGTAVAVIS